MPVRSKDREDWRSAKEESATGESAAGGPRHRVFQSDEFTGGGDAREVVPVAETPEISGN